MKFIPIILLCSTSIPTTDCNIQNQAVSVTRGEPQNTPMACIIRGQEQIAQTVIAPKLGESFYVVIKCQVKKEY